MNPEISPTYPYSRVFNYFQFGDADTIPYKVLTYLMDLPGAGYTPPDDNDYPRTRLKKYLYWDDSRPLENPLPTAAQMREIYFDPGTPDKPPNEEKGFRIFPQSLVTQAQTQGMTILRCYMGPTYPYVGNRMSAYEAQVTVCFELLSNTSYEANTGTTALSRTFAMACAIVDALNGVNITGVGTFYFDRQQNTYCGIMPINDESTNVGYRLYLGLTLAGGNIDGQCTI